MGNKIIALLGGACVGKDTVRNLLLERHKDLVVATSHTTRPLRTSENGTEYHFIDEAEFMAMYEHGEFVQTREYEVIAEDGNTTTWYYGYSSDEISKCLKRGNILMIVDLEGFKAFKEIYGDDCIGAYLNANKDLRVKRYLERDEITWQKVCECIRRIEDDDNRAFKDVDKYVEYLIDVDESSLNTCLKLEQIIELL